MKNYIILSLLFAAMGCSPQTKRYTQQSPEIETVKSAISNYVKGEWDAYSANYADGATIFFNATEENPASVAETIAAQKLSIEPLSTYSFDTDKEDLEMVVTDEGETWVNYWGTWKGTLAATGEEFVIPVHLTYQFVDGKVVKAYGYWNNTAIQMALMELQEASEMAEMETPE